MLLDKPILKGVTLYTPEVKVTIDGKEVLVQSIRTVKDKEPVTHIFIEGIILAYGI